MSYDTDNEKGNAAACLEAGLALAEPTPLVDNHALAFVLPAGAKVHVEDIEKFLDRPTRQRGTYNFGDAKSFIAYVNREKTADTIILANRENPGFTAVFNGNEAQNLVKASGEVVAMPLDADGARPGWGDYKATYACPYSPEWKVWSEANGKRMSQHDFASFMEDNFFDVVQPAATFDPYVAVWPNGNDMLAVSRGLEAKTDVRFASAVRLDNGQVRFKYEEDVSGSVQDGLMEVPQKFAVGIPVFAGTSPWQVIAKLRYRIERGGLSMWFDFERLFKITERAFDEARAEIAAGTSVPIYLGSKS